MKTKQLLTFLLILVAWTYICRWYHCRYGTPSVSDTVYVEKTVEEKDTAPGIKDEKVISQVSIPVHSNSPHIGKNRVKETGKSLHDTANIAKKDENLNTTAEPIVQRDSVTFDVVQRKYTDDSTYTAYVSGLRYDIYPRLDSVIVRQKMIERTITNTIYRDRQGLKLKLRPAFGGGYDPFNRQWGAYIGGALVLDW